MQAVEGERDQVLSENSKETKRFDWEEKRENGELGLRRNWDWNLISTQFDGGACWFQLEWLIPNFILK